MSSPQPVLLFEELLLTFVALLPQRDPFIQMYEERSVDVAVYVCRIQDQMPPSPGSPTFMD